VDSILCSFQLESDFSSAWNQGRCHFFHEVSGLDTWTCCFYLLPTLPKGLQPPLSVSLLFLASTPSRDFLCSSESAMLYYCKGCSLSWDVAFRSWLLRSNLKTNNSNKKTPTHQRRGKTTQKTNATRKKMAAAALRVFFSHVSVIRAATLFAGGLQPLVTKPGRVILPLFLPGDGRGLSKGQKFTRGCGCANRRRGAHRRSTLGMPRTGKVTTTSGLSACRVGKGLGGSQDGMGRAGAWHAGTPAMDCMGKGAVGTRTWRG